MIINLSLLKLAANTRAAPSPLLKWLHDCTTYKIARYSKYSSLNRIDRAIASIVQSFFPSLPNPSLWRFFAMIKYFQREGLFFYCPCYCYRHGSPPESGLEKCLISFSSWPFVSPSWNFVLKIYHWHFILNPLRGKKSFLAGISTIADPLRGIIN